MQDYLEYALAVQYANKLSIGVKSAVVSGSTITFTLSDGSTASITFPTPQDGRNVDSAEINVNGHLILHMSDGTDVDAGEMRTKLDKTLTVEGQAADAKAVGDKFAEFNGKYAKQTDINTLQNQINTNKSNISVNKTNIAQNKLDIIDLRGDVDDLQDDLATEKTTRNTMDIQLQSQIDKLNAKTQILGATDCPNGQEQTVLTAYARSVTGDSARPTEGDAINIVTDGSGNSRTEQWQYVAVQGKWVKMSGPPVVTKATNTSLGVVKAPLGGGVNIDADANITADKTSIGLGNVDNVRQYSKNNPAPVKIIQDGETYSGDTNSGVVINTGTIHYDRAQDLTETQKERARVNLGILENEDLTSRVEANEINIKKNTEDLKTLDTTVKDINEVVTKEVDDRTKADEHLQEQIDALEAKGEWIGSIATIGGDLTKLTAFVKSEKSRDPISGDIVSVVDEDAQYRFNGTEWSLYISTAQKDASTTVKGVVKIKADGGIKVDAGEIDADKASIGLSKVENERQYSEENPVPISFKLDEVEYTGDSKDGVEGTTTNVKYTSQILSSEEQEQARANIGALGVFKSENERDNFKTQVENNKTDISDIKDEQVLQNTQIANLQKKSQWIGSIENAEDSEVTDAMLNAAILEKVGTTPKEGYQLSVFGSDGNSTVYQYSETSKTWAISSKNADLQIASDTQLGLIQASTGIKVDDDGLATVDTSVIATKAYVDAHSGGGTSSQGDWTEEDPTASSYIKNKPYGDVPIVTAETSDTVLSGDETHSFTDTGKTYYWIGDEFVSITDIKNNLDAMVYFTSADRDTPLSGGITFINNVDDYTAKFMIDIDDVSYYFCVVGEDIKSGGEVTRYRGIYATPTSKGYFVAKIYSTKTSTRLPDKSLIDTIYPIGSVYFSMVHINPVVYFGGTWEEIAQGRFIAGVGTGTDKNKSTFKVEKGASTQTLTAHDSKASASGDVGEYTHKMLTRELISHRHMKGNDIQTIGTTYTNSSGVSTRNGNHTHKVADNVITKQTYSDAKKDADKSWGWIGGKWSSGTSNPVITLNKDDSSSDANDGRHKHYLRLSGYTRFAGGDDTDTNAAWNGARTSANTWYSANNIPPTFGLYMWKRTA